MKILHKLAHLFGVYHGTVESFWINDVLWVGFKCSTCNEISSARMSDARFSYKFEPPHEKTT